MTVYKSSRNMAITYIYTSSQRHGITTTSWHLREFDRYLSSSGMVVGAQAPLAG